MTRSYSLAQQKFDKDLIQEVQKYEFLYDNKNSDFRNIEKKEETWLIIGRKLYENADKCRCRWKDLRKQYANQYMRMTTPGAVRYSFWRYTEEMSFLKAYEEQKPQKCTSSDPVEGGNFTNSDIYCRACLSKFIDNSGKRSKSYNIFEISDLAEKLTQCSNCQVVQWDEYPQSVCENCYKKIEYCSEFQLLCRTSLQKYNSILHNPKLVTLDLDKTLGISLNCVLEDSYTNSFLEDVVEPPTTLKASKKNKIPQHTHYDIEFANITLKEKNQVTVEKAKTEKRPSPKDITLNSKLTSAVETNECMSRNIKIEEQQPERVVLADDDDGEDEYIVDDLTDQEESFSEDFNVADGRGDFNENKGSSSCTVFKCDIGDCDEIYTCNSSLNHHKRECHRCGIDPRKNKKEHSTKWYICETCGLVVSSRAVLKTHRLLHVDKSQWPYGCDEKDCTKRFRVFSQYRVHKKRHAGIKNYVCPHCGTRKTTNSELRIHINSSHALENEKPHACPVCGKTFGCKAYLKHHMMHAHLEDEKPYVCEECGRRFKWPDPLKVHMKHHSEKDAYGCDECGKRFKWASSLKTHKKLHVEGAIPYTCEECGQGFRWPGSYYAHKKKHVGQNNKSATHG